jgi:Tfp pilus assembly protein PilX
MSKRQNERGFSIAAAILVLLVLTALGVTVLNSVNTDIEIAGQQRTSESALQLAEAGVAWGQWQIRNAYYGNFSYLLVTAAANAGEPTPPPEITGDTDCPNTSCLLFGWRDLSGGTVAYGGGTYRVAIKDDDDGDGNLNVDDNNRILLRSLGTDPSGTRRLVEVALMVD